MGKLHMQISPFFYVIKGNKRKRTCTVRKFRNGEYLAKYRTVPLDPAQFESLMAATKVPEVDEILKKVDYYVIR